MLRGKTRERGGGKRDEGEERGCRRGWGWGGEQMGRQAREARETRGGEMERGRMRREKRERWRPNTEAREPEER